MEKSCILEEKVCNNCGECNLCDLNPAKICDDCGKCIESDFDSRAIEISGIIRP